MFNVLLGLLIVEIVLILAGAIAVYARRCRTLLEVLGMIEEAYHDQYNRAGKLEREVYDLVTALKFYARGRNDNGRRARRILEKGDNS
jgi:hypothetical protein